MWIFKRDGRKEPGESRPTNAPLAPAKLAVAFDKVTARINKLSYGLDPNFVEPAEITQKVVQGIHAGITTVELDVSPSKAIWSTTADVCRTLPPRRPPT